MVFEMPPGEKQWNWESGEQSGILMTGAWILASANDKDFLIFENWCRVGPTYTRVDRLEISELDQTCFIDFSIDD